MLVDLAEALDIDLEREFPPNRKDKSMDPNRIYQNAVGAEPREETPFDRLNDALERLSAAEDQLSGLTDKLLGQRPPEQTAAGKLASVPSGGVFGNVDGVAIRVSALAEQIAGYTSRIARQIP